MPYGASSRFRRYIRRNLIIFLKNPNAHYFKCFLNFMNYLRHPQLAMQDRIAWKRNFQVIRGITNKENSIAFTIYGFKAGNTDINLYQFLAITSYVYQNPNIPVYIFYAFENDGIYWKELNKYAIKIQLYDFTFYKMAMFNHYAHKSDILRLLILQKVGGLYFDIDTFSVGKSERIAHPTKAILGIEQNPGTNETSGICNAIMWSPRGNIYIQEWINYYKSFYSKGKDAFWGDHSIKLPLRILSDSRFHSHATALPPHKLFAINWLRLNETIFSTPSQNLWDPAESPPVIHLWETLAQEDLNRITPEFIRNSDSWYAIQSREIIQHLNLSLHESD